MTDAARDEDFELRILAFEQAWKQGTASTLRSFLPVGQDLAEHLRLLHELICVDLECRRQWAAKHKDQLAAWHLQDYIRQFPELGELDKLPLELIGEEYRVRWRWGDRPSHSEFLARFASRRDEIGRMLNQIDRELRLEAEEKSEQRSVSTAGPAESRLKDEPDGSALLSYDDFVLERLIWGGQMGRVYRARRRDEDRPVAIKYLRKVFHRNAAAIQRFITEARTVAQLRHVGLVGVHGLGRTPGGGYFIVMDLIDGVDLARYIEQNGGADPVEAVRWTIEACEALQHAHWHGIVHCDLKPGNVLLDQDRHVHVTDFGLARSLSDNGSADDAIEGTAPFMAPEQVSRYWGIIGPRTDVYGLGAVLFTLLTGRPPYIGRTVADVLAAVVSASPVMSLHDLRPDLPKALRDLCERCLAKKPEQRYQNLAELGRALLGCLAQLEASNA